MKIYRDISGVQVEVERISDENTLHRFAIMGLDEVQSSIVVDSPLNVEVDDYVVLDGVRYTLNRGDEYEIRSDVQYSYDLTFEHPQYTLINKLLANRITGEKTFTLTGKLSDFVNLLVWCVNIDTNPEGIDIGWIVGSIMETGYKTITIDVIDCREALKLFAKEFDCEYYFSGDGKTVNFVDRVERTTSHVFEQGREMGLYRIQQQNVDKGNAVTRVIVRGGNDNVPPAYADENGYLKLPENYLEDFSEYSKVVEAKQVFEEEFPHFLGTVEAVTGEFNRTITCRAIDFDVQAIAVGDNARVNFLTGDLMGKSFEFQWDNSAKRITLIDQEDELALPDEDGVRPSIPSALKKASVGDEFNFTGVFMPASYVDASLARLRTKGRKWLDYHSKKRVKFAIDIDHRWMRGKNPLLPGDLVVISIPQKGLFQAIRVTEIEKRLSTGEVSATVSNYLEDTWERYDEYKAGLKQNEILGFQSNVNIINGVMHRDRGAWNETTAEVKPYLRTSNIVDDAWHLGCKWRCMVNKTTVEPSFVTDHWMMIEGNSEIRMEIFSSGGTGFFGGSVDTTFTPTVYVGNTNVSGDITESNWSWERDCGDPARDAIWNSEHEGMRVISITDVDMSPLWAKNNPVKFTCTAIHPNSSINKVTRTIEYSKA